MTLGKPRAVGLPASLAAIAAATALLATPPARAAGAQASGARLAPSEIFAVVVTNNRSTRLDRPDLQYADDDGARYYQMFRGVASAEHVRLLTRFDRTTAGLHPELVPAVQPPRRAALLATLAEVRAAVLEAHRAGRRTEFYFVFAGHGDVEGGIGYLDLEDARIDPTFLEHEVVDQVPADALHVVLDSCNSFFVVNPRKPGGRRWATPRDLALGFAARHPNVGLFLSTNSEAEVYEWSELESGIFSHEVRSGLSGAADVDGDGRVSYAELAGFVDRANAKLPRSNLRPQVFQRGPNGDAGAALFSPAQAAGRRLMIGAGERRLWIRGAGNERLLDLHKEDAPVTIVVPGEADQPLTVAEWRDAEGPTDRPAVAAFDVPPGTAPIVLAALLPHASEETARGGAAIFGALFKLPYGPQAFTSFLAESAHGDEPVYGVGAADEARMRHYLTFIAESDREVSRNQGLAVGGTGAVLIGTGLTLALSSSGWNDQRTAGLIVAGLGLPLLAIGLDLGFSKPVGQLTLETFQSELARPGADRSAVVAHIETNLDHLARVERRKARFTAGYMGAVSVLLAAAVTTRAVEGGQGREPAALVGGYASTALVAAIAWRVLDTEMPTERLLRLYRSDPDLGPHLGIVPPVPTSNGTTPAMVSISGRF
jgi:hypothetical protein